MVLYSYRETVSLKIFKKLAGPLVYYSGSNEHSLALAPQFKWLEYTFKQEYTGSRTKPSCRRSKQDLPRL
jgi:hypothetical protein